MDQKTHFAGTLTFESRKRFISRWYYPQLSLKPFYWRNFQWISRSIKMARTSFEMAKLEHCLSWLRLAYVAQDSTSKQK